MPTDEQKAKRVVNQTAYRARKKAGLSSCTIECKPEHKPLIQAFAHNLEQDGFTKAYNEFMKVYIDKGKT